MTEQKQWKPGDVAIADGYGQLPANEAFWFGGMVVRVVSFDPKHELATVEPARGGSARIHVRNLSEPPKEPIPHWEPDIPEEEPKPGTWRCPTSGTCPPCMEAMTCVRREVYRATNQPGPTGYQPDTRKGEWGRW